MHINDFLNDIVLNNEQNEALSCLETFLSNESTDVFILRGYAGTGKTTLLKGVITYLRQNGRAFEVMAPTGRAAKVLKDKTGFGRTIHSTIYDISDIPLLDDKRKDKKRGEENKIAFPISKYIIRSSILIIDEASMISSRVAHHPYLIFGTEVLLEDILTYANIDKLKTKIIFVGDPAQLPPIDDNRSWALDSKYFEERGLKVDGYELRIIARQDNNNILRNAMLLRDKIYEVAPNSLVLEYDENSFIKREAEDVVPIYTEIAPEPKLNSVVVISYTNRQCFHYNQAIRDVYFPGNNHIQVGDIIQIVYNNYYTYPTEIYNGDFAEVLEVSDNIKSKEIKISNNVNGNTKEQKIYMSFRTVKIQLSHYDQPFECEIIDSFLNSPDRELSKEENRALNRDYFNRNGKASVDNVYKDPYLNAIRCKYGYAITCHKAQGGEWENVIVDYKGQVSLREGPLRWCYTATTRAIKRCYAVNAPHFTQLSKFTIKDVEITSKIPQAAFCFDSVPLSPFHSIEQNRCKSDKYWQIINRFENTPYKVKDIFSRDFLERYTVSNGISDYILEGYHNKTGVFEKGFKMVSTGHSQEDIVTLESLFNEPPTTNTIISYSPSTESLDELYSIVQSACIDLNIPITNIVENLEQYYVIYFFRTDSLSSYIQFYFNNKGQLTSAIPRTYKCNTDLLLKQLIKKIESYVIQ